jgi:hypothetical protein
MDNAEWGPSIGTAPIVSMPEENASKIKWSLRSDSIGTEKALAPPL